MARLTIRITDSLTGQPADGVHIEVFWLGPNDAVHPLRETVTGPDGSPRRPLLEGQELDRGEYLLNLNAGDYYRAAGVVEVEPRFLQVVAIRVAIADPEQDYHVPVVLGPWSYTVFRG